MFLKLYIFLTHASYRIKIIQYKNKNERFYVQQKFRLFPFWMSCKGAWGEVSFYDEKNASEWVERKIDKHMAKINAKLIEKTSVIKEWK